MILQELITAKTNPRIELDTILSELCELIINKQNQDSDYYGMVAACVVCPDGQRVYGINYALEDGTRVHAERAAIDACANISPDCIIVTTLSPCNKHMNERHGDSCEDLIESLGITHVYCGYKDPTQRPDASIETRNPKLRELCKKFADTFLKENFASHGKMFENAKSKTL